eukprot:TRINITY_DN100707_c0_g1_i1.p1 TRINITY_DN100707_c0_g1~~TRINITY_DN100707_c0_g1_i1.p1  ORF type:complete len:242 (+),score=78.13 TRINITY_DN100707_c0_g1_i1:151-876(+)
MEMLLQASIRRGRAVRLDADDSVAAQLRWRSAGGKLPPKVWEMDSLPFGQLDSPREEAATSPTASSPSPTKSGRRWFSSIFRGGGRSGSETGKQGEVLAGKDLEAAEEELITKQVVTLEKTLRAELQCIKAGGIPCRPYAGHGRVVIETKRWADFEEEIHCVRQSARKRIEQEWARLDNLKTVPEESAVEPAAKADIEKPAETAGSQASRKNVAKAPGAGPAKPADDSDEEVDAAGLGVRH